MASKLIDNGDGTTTLQLSQTRETTKTEKRIEKAALYLWNKGDKSIPFPSQKGKQLDIIESYVWQVIKDLASTQLYTDAEASARQAAQTAEGTI